MTDGAPEAPEPEKKQGVSQGTKTRWISGIIAALIAFPPWPSAMRSW